MPPLNTSPIVTGAAAAARSTADPVDEMINRYAGWRDDAAAVSDAYADWRAAPRAEAAWRFSTYLAALDAEEASAGNYARAVAEVARSLECGLSA